ncbi:MAG: dTMP kinase [Candidatus Diapherotrites archaeon]|nr:dTMP kinase [Candidatus Diapherotrites archaeon]MDZ4256319.1 dTMP kinase [archaeon]
MGKGLFIVLDGIDGSGKTVQAGKLAEWVFNHYKPVFTIVLTKEYTGSKFGKEIHERLFKTADDSSTQKERMLELFVLDREDHVDHIIAPMLEQGALIICDRYKYATIAYQTAQGVLSSHAIKENEGFPIPDLVLIFNIPVEESVSRMEKAGKPLAKFEKRAFLERVKNEFAQLPQKLPKENIVFINANQTIESVHRDVVAQVKPFIENMVK